MGIFNSTTIHTEYGLDSDLEIHPFSLVSLDGSFDEKDWKEAIRKKFKVDPGFRQQCWVLILHGQHTKYTGPHAEQAQEFLFAVKNKYF